MPGSGAEMSQTLRVFKTLRCRLLRLRSGIGLLSAAETRLLSAAETRLLSLSCLIGISVFYVHLK